MCYIHFPLNRCRVTDIIVWHTGRFTILTPSLPLEYTLYLNTFFYVVVLHESPVQLQSNGRLLVTL